MNKAASNDMGCDAAFTGRAIRLAMNGRGRVEPNPMVGCVIVRGGRVIGEGYHQHFGGPHAEPNALAACAAAGESPAAATAYVTLEPCCHTDKKTPPCVPKLIEAKLARVVVGCVDPNPRVSGRGLALLREAGIETAAPVPGAEAKQLIAPFIARVKHGRPYVTLKWAESADGKVAGPGGRRVQISNAASSRLAHALRARSDAILVGIGTVINDDPILTTRGVDCSRPLRRVVLDSRLRLPPDSRLARTAREQPLVVFTSQSAFAAASPVAGKLHELLAGMGAAVLPVSTDDRGRLSLRQVLRSMDAAVTHLMVEPGPVLARSFLEEGLADRLWVFRSPRRVDDETAPAAVPVPPGYVLTRELDLEGDRLAEYLDARSEVYFAACPSPDVVLHPGTFSGLTSYAGKFRDHHGDTEATENTSRS